MTKLWLARDNSVYNGNCYLFSAHPKMGSDGGFRTRSTEYIVIGPLRGSALGFVKIKPGECIQVELRRKK